MAKTLIHQAIEAERGPEQMRAFNTLSDSVQGDQESPESVAIDQATQGQQFTRILGSVGGAVAARLKNETGSRFNTQHGRDLLWIVVLKELVASGEFFLEAFDKLVTETLSRLDLGVLEQAGVSIPAEKADLPALEHGTVGPAGTVGRQGLRERSARSFPELVGTVEGYIHGTEVTTALLIQRVLGAIVISEAAAASVNIGQVSVGIKNMARIIVAEVQAIMTEGEEGILIISPRALELMNGKHSGLVKEIKSMGHSATTPERSTQALMEYDLLCLVALAFPLITKPRLLAVLQQLMSQLPNVPHPVPRDIESDRFTGTYPVTLENFDAAWKKLQQTVDEAKPPVPPASRGGEDVPSA